MKLIVGLGNPGPAYSATRHNLGFKVVSRLARVWHITVGKRRFKARLGSGCVDRQKVILAKPQSFMNLSGQAVKLLINYYHLPREDMLVICDDINLLPGRIRVRTGGSHGGHKGLLSIINELQTEDFARLRIGIGKSGDISDLSKYVLSQPDNSQRPLLEEGLRGAAEAVQTWLKQGVTACMNKYN